MDLVILQCSKCDHINILPNFTKTTKDKTEHRICPVCGNDKDSFRILKIEKGYDYIHSVILIVLNNFKVLSSENMSDITRIFSLTPAQEDSILTSLQQYGFIVINGGMQMEFD